MTLEAIRYQRSPPSLLILDQLLLPHETSWLKISGSEAAHAAIRSMQVRGAPAIALVAALSLIIEDPIVTLSPHDGNNAQINVDQVVEWYRSRLDYLVTSRPTAVNLSDAAEKLKRIIKTTASGEVCTVKQIRDVYVASAEKMLESDMSDNKAIGAAGSTWIQEKYGLGGADGSKCSVVTHCNTGSLATAGYGTALGIVRSLHTDGLLHHAYYTETRPYNQGSRLTGYELLHDHVPATLITDSMAGALFRLKSKKENIVAVIVGADRVAANGDTANKIGTYGLAVLARQHGIAFLVAAPRTTIDLSTVSGEDIVIEDRPQNEVLSVKGPKVVGFDGHKQVVEPGNAEFVSIAALGTTAWNPAFDVTPASLIDAIVTERGVVEKDGSTFNLGHLFDT